MHTLPKPPEPISQSLPSGCLQMMISLGLISHDEDGTTSGRLDAPLYCLLSTQSQSHRHITHRDPHAGLVKKGYVSVRNPLLSSPRFQGAGSCNCRRATVRRMFLRCHLSLTSLHYKEQAAASEWVGA